MAIKRAFFDEYTDGCLYHPKPGCVHPSDDASAKFISSLVHDTWTRAGEQLHAPALDIDVPVELTQQTDEGAHVKIKGPRPKRKDLNALLDVLVSTCLMTPENAKALRWARRLSERCVLPVLPLMVQAELHPSSTTGHFHLYLEEKMSWGNYKELLLALCAAKVIEKNFCDMSLKWRSSFLLKPGLTKRDLKLKFKAA